MGIPKLSSFVDQTFSKWQHRAITAYEKLVIDGNNICYHWTRGGSYHKFYDTVTTFFQALLASKIEPIVITDGIYEEKKIETTRSRRENSQEDKRLAEKRPSTSKTTAITFKGSVPRCFTRS